MTNPKPILQPETLSAPGFLITKAVMPAVVATAIVVSLGREWLSSPTMRGMLLLIALAMLLIWANLLRTYLVPLKQVDLSSEGLHVRGLRSSTRVAFEDIAEVKGGRRITVILRSPGVFGRRFLFIPRQPHLNFGEHPVVLRLRVLAGLAQASRAGSDA